VFTELPHSDAPLAAPPHRLDGDAQSAAAPLILVVDDEAAIQVASEGSARRLGLRGHCRRLLR
jgi:hypothetical protein